MSITPSCCPACFELKVGNFYIALAGENGPRARPEDHPRPHEAGPAGLRRRRSHPSTRASRRRRRFATASSRRRATFPSGSWARPTTADSRPSATTLRPPATRRSPRSAPACWARLAAQALGGALVGAEEVRRQTATRTRPEERRNYPHRPAARRTRALRGERSSSAQHRGTAPATRMVRVTLSSIGDAVITTDLQGKVTFLNPVAESMTGWTSALAQGKALDEVFSIVNEETRRRSKIRSGRCSRPGRSSG